MIGCPLPLTTSLHSSVFGRVLQGWQVTEKILGLKV